MPRELKLLRRITAGGGGWAGDGPDWSQSNPPAAVLAPHTEASGFNQGPIFTVPIQLTEAPQFPAKGFAGYMRVIGDPARLFSLKVFMEWVRTEKGLPSVYDWRLPVRRSDRILGDGGDFTSDPAQLRDSRVAFHLTPIAGNLAAGSVVELWMGEI